MSRADDAVELIRRMVEIRSESGDEAAIASYLVEQMRARGFEASVDDAGNAIGIRGGEPPAGGDDWRDIVLLGHMDTVPGEIPVRIEDGVLHGRGSVDAKGPLATFVQAAGSGAIPDGTRWIVIGAVEEEVASSKGARHVRDRFAPAMCVIGEPSGWDAAVVGYKGRLVATFEAVQPGGHSAGPQGGVGECAIAWWNGIVRHAAAFNRGHEKLFEQLLPALLSMHTTTDGLHDRSEAVAGLRLPPGIEMEDLAATLESLATACGGTARCVGREPAYRSSRTSDLARQFGRAFAGRGLRPRFKVKTGTSDMNVVGPVWDCPIVAYGPGDSALDHTPTEHLVLSEYERAIEVLREVLEGV